MPTIHCKTQLYTIGSLTLCRLPRDASAKLPSRGMAMAEGTINGFAVQLPLEPDGNKSHWFTVDEAMREAADAAAGDTVTLALEPLDDWPEPDVPADLQAMLAADPEAHDLWLDTTTKARWDWIRWIRSTKNPDTRAIRIEKARSKLKSGKRRPCCFNRSACTEPSVSKSGKLIEPTELAE
jgi:hypothetical protein